MRRLKCIILCCLVCATISAQQRHAIETFNDLQSEETIDSLRRLLKTNLADSTRAHALHRLAYPTLFFSPDSAMILVLEGLKLAVSSGYKKGELLCKTDIAAVWWILGDYPKANLLLLENLESAEKLNDPETIEWTISFLMTIYREQNNPAEALRLCLKGADRHEYFSPKMWNTMVGSVYTSMAKYDSAFSYLKEGDGGGYNLLLLAEVFSGKGNNTQAFHYYQQSLQKLEELNNFKDMVYVYAGLARLYEKEGLIDSAINVAKQGFDIADRIKLKRGVFETSRLLSTFYEKRDKSQALHYLKVSVEANDSLFNLRKITGALELRYNEQLRERELAVAVLNYKNRLRTIVFSIALAVFLLAAILFYRNSRQKQRARARIEKAYTELKATQAQLIQAEKMASLGQLTAGIAHEIQNPLNFINNFSEVNKELLAELKQEIDKGNLVEVKEIANAVIDNEDKINHHGKKADAIVKSMLQHSNRGSGKKEPTELNALADEYLRLAYHGLRAKDKSFNTTVKTDFDSSIGKINAVRQEIGRVMLNLINNAFYAVNERAKLNESGYEPAVSISTRKTDNKVVIKVADNGTGIPENISDKIFQPFFTTKPTGQGTGLGLSLAYDIVKAHGGNIKIETKEREGSEFIIQLPIT